MTYPCHEITFYLYVLLFIYLQQCSDLLVQGTDKSPSLCNSEVS